MPWTKAWSKSVASRYPITQFCGGKRLLKASFIHNIRLTLQSKFGSFFHYKDNDGRRFRTRKGKGRDKQYADIEPGIPMLDVWSLNVASPSQRTGYPTEKPLPLLNRIIQCSTKENDIVCDPFCGSGTTLLAARNLKRRYIGIDINNDAVLTSQKRLGVEPSENGGQNV